MCSDEAQRQERPAAGGQCLAICTIFCQAQARWPASPRQRTDAAPSRLTHPHTLVSQGRNAVCTVQHRAAVMSFSGQLRLPRTIAPTVSLYVNDYNKPARATYARVGFDDVGEFATIHY